MQVHMSLNGNTKILLAVALSQAVVTPFTKNDWRAYCDAIGTAHRVHFRPEHAAKLATALGIDHWVPEYTVVILDESGLSWNGSSPVNGYAWAVRVDLDVSGGADPGTPKEYWATDKQRPYGGALEQVIAQLPADVRSMVMSCPDQAREHVVRGYLESAQAKAKIWPGATGFDLMSALHLLEQEQKRAAKPAAAPAAKAEAQDPRLADLPEDVRQTVLACPVEAQRHVIDGYLGSDPSPAEQVAKALELLQQVDMSGYGGLYDAMPWADLECFAKGRVQHPHQDVANRGRVWIYKNEMGLVEIRGQQANGCPTPTMFQDSLETAVINWYHLQYDHMGDAKPVVTWAAPTLAEQVPASKPGGEA